jgi:TRAP-type C4-dicarboxylate transport system permease small subunit
MRRTLEYLIALLLLLMSAITFYQVVARVVFQVSSVWSEELARYTYVWMVFLGAAVLIRDDALIRVGVLTDRLTGRAGAVLRFLTALAALPFLAVLTWGAWLNTRSNWNTILPTIDWLTIGYVYLGMCASGIIMLWYAVLCAVQHGQAALLGGAQPPGSAA